MLIDSSMHPSWSIVFLSVHAGTPLCWVYCTYQRTCCEARLYDDPLVWRLVVCKLSAWMMGGCEGGVCTCRRGRPRRRGRR